MFMKSHSFDIHAPLISQDCVAASRKSDAFSARKVSGALTRRCYSGLAILAAGEKCELALLPFENSEPDVPEGQMKIAQRFNAGMYATSGTVPKGRLKNGNDRFTLSRLFGTRIQSPTIPAGLEPGKDWLWYKR